MQTSHGTDEETEAACLSLCSWFLVGSWQLDGTLDMKSNDEFIMDPRM